MYIANLAQLKKTMNKSYRFAIYRVPLTQVMCYHCRYDAKTDKLYMSYSEFKTKSVGFLGRLVLWAVKLLRLCDVQEGAWRWWLISGLSVALQYKLCTCYPLIAYYCDNTSEIPHFD